MEERLHHFELHSEYFIVDIRYLSKVLFRFPIVVLCYYFLNKFHLRWGNQDPGDLGMGKVRGGGRKDVIFFPSSRGEGGTDPG